MFGIQRQTDYAARLVLHLACLGDGALVSIGEIARERRLPVYFVRRIISPLVTSRILATHRGINGGVRLARPASEISLLDVVSAMEGGVALNQCVDGGGGCPFVNRCPVEKAWTRATRVLEQNLGEVRFDALARAFEGHQEGHRNIDLVPLHATGTGD